MTVTIDTTPPAAPQTSREDIVWGVDMAAQLTGVQTVTAPVSVLRNSAGAPVTLEDAPSVQGTVIKTRIRAGVLARGTYYLMVLFTPSGTTNVLESRLKIVCPY